MKIIRIIISMVLILCVSVTFIGCSLFTVVKHSENESGKDGTKFYFEDSSFNADEFVGSIWNEKIIPYMESKSVDILKAISDIKNNSDDAGSKYGFKNSGSTKWTFAVKGSGKVLKVNQESRNGKLDVDLEPFDGKKDIAIQIGPVYKGTSIRDSLDFVKFEDHKNQLVFASISNAMNKYVNDNIVNKLDLNNLNGQEISFIGTFTLDNPEDLVITPVRLERMGN